MGDECELTCDYNTRNYNNNAPLIHVMTLLQTNMAAIVLTVKKEELNQLVFDLIIGNNALSVPQAAQVQCGCHEESVTTF